MRPFLSRLRQEQDGAVMVIAAVSFTVLLLFAGLALDFGRAHLLKSQLQTAVDAASLAGALQVVPMVEIDVERMFWEEKTCVDPLSKRAYDCSGWIWTSPARMSGPEWNLIVQEGWQTGPGCSHPYTCQDYTVVRQWLVLPPTTLPVAEETFRQNSTWPGGTLGAIVRDLRVTVDQSKVEVTTTATITTPTSFLKLAGIRELRMTTTGSAVPVRR